MVTWLGVIWLEVKREGLLFMAAVSLQAAVTDPDQL